MGAKGLKNKPFKAFFKTISGLWCPQGVREVIPQAWGGSTEGHISHGPKFGSGYVEAVRVRGVEGVCFVMLVENFFEVGGGMAMDTLVSEEGNLVLNPGGNGKPVE